jgi:hypothetical protein
MGPSLDSLAGMDGEIWSGSLILPCCVRWIHNFLSVFENGVYLLGRSCWGWGAGGAVARMGAVIPLPRILAFLFMLLVSMSVLYSILLLLLP